MYEEIIKSLRLCREILHEDDSCIEFVDGSCEAFPICAYQLMEKAADAIEEMQKCIDGIEADNESLCIKIIEELSNNPSKLDSGFVEWIPVTERLPEDGSWQIFTDGEHISVERYKVDAFDHFFPAGRWFDFEEATHWMPIPEPPKEET